MTLITTTNLCSSDQPFFAFNTVFLPNPSHPDIDCPIQTSYFLFPFPPLWSTIFRLWSHPVDIHTFRPNIALLQHSSNNHHHFLRLYRPIFHLLPYFLVIYPFVDNTLPNEASKNHHLPSRPFANTFPH